jgi:two-component system response regulator
MRNKIILLVEDSRDDEELTLGALKKYDIMSKVVVARDGAEALDCLLDAGVEPESGGFVLPELVLLDLRLPKIDGLEVLRRLRADERTKRLPVVIFTSSKEEQDCLDGYKLGVNSYVRKPIELEDFAEAARQLGLYWLLLNLRPSSARTYA